MSRTTTYRFEVSHVHYGTIAHEQTLRSAAESAQRWMRLPNNDYQDKTAIIFDRMHRKNTDGVYTVSICDGEAHSNVFIDNCGKCMPLWGTAVHPYSPALTR